jgi:hypothetical protein
MTSRKIAVRSILTIIALTTLAQASTAQQHQLVAPPVQQTLNVAPASPLSDLFGPAASPKTCGGFCNTGLGGSTSAMVGTGASCSDALANLTAQLHAVAVADCMNQNGTPVCNFTVGTRPCGMTGPDTYTIQGVANYNCRDTTC